MSEQGVTVESAKEILAKKDAPKAVAEAPKKEVPAKAAPKTAPAKPAKSSTYAVILIRGDLGMRHDVKQALETLRLRRKHVCAILPGTPDTLGLLRKVKDWAAFGPVSDSTVKELQKRGSLKGKDGKDLNLFRLHPPRGGFGRKGIKVSYNNGGVLGLNPKMDDLITRML